MGSLVAAAQQLAAQLSAAGVPAVVDPAAAETRRPCVLVAPPVVDYVARANRWRLIALAGVQQGLAALDQLDELVQAVVDQAQLDVERAEPGTYQLTEAGQVPAYVLTLTT